MDMGIYEIVPNHGDNHEQVLQMVAETERRNAQVRREQEAARLAAIRNGMDPLRFALMFGE